jgi:Spy/CpxP family protein refolding chaperone
MGFGMPMGFGPTQLLSRQDVRKELELLDDQIKQLDALEQKMRDRMSQALPRPAGPGQGRAQEGSRDPRRDQEAPKPQTDFRQIFEQINKETRAEQEKILLPHQLKRLDQLSAQLRMQNLGFALMGGDVARDLGVTDQQREELRTKIEEIDRETRKQEAELRRQAREKVIKLLTPDQQTKLKDMTGEWFTFEMQGPPQRFGQPGGFGPPQGGPGGPGGPSRGDDRRPQRPN